MHIHPHRFRHTFATTLLSRGIPVSEVAAILGNSPRIIEKHYLQWIQVRQESINAAIKTCQFSVHRGLRKNTMAATPTAMKTIDATSEPYFPRPERICFSR